MCTQNSVQYAYTSFAHNCGKNKKQLKCLSVQGLTIMVHPHSETQVSNEIVKKKDSNYQDKRRREIIFKICF